VALVSMSRSVFLVNTPNVGHGRWAEWFAWHGHRGSSARSLCIMAGRLRCARLQAGRISPFADTRLVAPWQKQLLQS